jgi:hypothetical protein
MHSEWGQNSTDFSEYGSLNTLTNSLRLGQIACLTVVRNPAVH